MDEKFLELWGNLLLSAAQGKKQTNDVFRWMQSGFPNLNDTSQNKPGFPDFNELSAMFHRLYGLDKLSAQSENYKEMSEKALQDFQKSFKNYLDSLGIVSRDEHLTLIKKYENLKAKCADQEETIKHLKMLLDSKGMNQPETSSQFQEIIKTQGELFQKMIMDFGQHFSKPDLNKNKINPEKETSEREELKND